MKIQKIKEIKNKREYGITLVALVVTIIVLLILASVSINLVLGDNGIIRRAKEAGVATRFASIIDERDMWLNDNKISSESGLQIKNLDEFLEELKNKNLLNEEEVLSIKNSPDNSVQIGDKLISFKSSDVNSVVEPKNIDDWEYVEENGYIRITNYKGNDTILVIPNYINGVPVKRVYTTYTPYYSGGTEYEHILQNLYGITL